MNKAKSSKIIEVNKSKSSDFDLPKKSIPTLPSDSVKRNWLKKHGKTQYIDFDDAERKELRRYFDALDADRGDELEDPLIGLGLVSNREEVLKLVEEVDEDKSGVIEFQEFLQIMSNIKNKGAQNEEESVLYNFFKAMINGQLMDNMDPTMPFLLNVSTFRRRKIMEAIMQKDKEGSKILNNFKKLIVQRKQEEKIKKGENPNDLSIEQPPSNETGILSSKTGVFKPNEIKSITGNLLLKPKSIPIQTSKKMK